MRFFLIKQTLLAPCPLALEKYPDVSGSRQLPRQNAPTLSMCFQGFHWLFPPQFCLLLFWERREKKNKKYTDLTLNPQAKAVLSSCVQHITAMFIEE